MTSKIDGGKSQDPELLDLFLFFDLLFSCFEHLLSFILIHLIILVLDAESECFQLNMKRIRVQLHLCFHSSELTKPNLKYCEIFITNFPGPSSKGGICVQTFGNRTIMHASG